jgi:hypothetical protein
VTIPDFITSIGYEAFSDCKSLVSVTIPNWVTSIGGHAFEGCSNLKNVTITDLVASIGDYAFCECENLTSVTIPNSVTSIGCRAFESCSNLTNILDSVASIGDYAFYKCENLTRVNIPTSVTSIGYCAFEDCSNLKSINIPDSVTSIGDSAFKDCSNLKSITIPDSVTSISDSAFESCSNLTSVTIPNSVTSIGKRAFLECGSLTSIVIPDSVISIGDSAFEGCNFSSFTIPKTVRKVGRDSFRGCKEITVYDSIDPDAKPCKSHSDKYGGSPNSLLGSVVNYKTHDNWLDYEVTVRSAQTDEIKYKVWMGGDCTQGEYCYTLASSWGRNATFNFNAVDEFFPKIKGVYHKIKVAMNRLRYPIDLTDEKKEMYRSYIVRSAKNAVKLCIDTDDMELLLSCEPLGIIKKNNIEELIGYATEKKAVQFTAYLLEYKESHFKKGKNALDSLKL